jgi:DNA-binding NtrC family response regulator
VLVASPSSSLREQVLHSLHHPRCQVQEVSGGADALVKLESGSWQLLFLDRRLPDLDTEELVEIIKRRFPGIEVVLLDSDSDQGLPPGAARWRTAAPAGETGLRGQFRNPLLRYSASEREGSKPEGGNADPLPGMIGQAQAMQRVYKLARLVAPRPTTVLITGPTGSGKELVARAIHRLSPRAAKAFMVVNCAAIPESLLEAELFGYNRGAFTGAVQAYAGRIQAAQGGTLFLDEIGELPLGLQAKLLRFLDQKEVQRLGSSDTLHADVRVLAATNLDLAEAVDQGRFRGDLYYRLTPFPLHLPSLRERSEDILALAEHFLREIAREARAVPLQLSPSLVEALALHPWEGNVRELQQVLERAAILAAEEGSIQPHHLYFPEGSRRRPMREPAGMQA